MRAFISINLPSDFSISLNFNELKGIKFKGVEDKNMHITLKFLGEINEKDVDEISDALKFIENEKKFKFSLEGISAFPDEDYVKVLWIKIKDGYENICELERRIDKALKSKFGSENNFVPHLTVARIKYVNDKNSLKNFIEKYKNFKFGEFTAEKVSLMKSVLKKDGPVYTEIKNFLLKD